MLDLRQPAIEDRIVFTDVEFRFLVEHPRGRLSTIGPDDSPQIHPVVFVVSAGSGDIDITSPHLRDTQKYRNVRRDPRVSLAVDDPERPLLGDDPRGRGITLDGYAEATERAGLDVIRIHPLRLDDWNIEDTVAHHTRFL
jgi:pyridoxamine 5'-phosphate oxidase family protein